ncbi:J domain-containing protein [Flammeovirga aprica]|uniref:J domain-containing protein n=1 Tax=Flammeovirga aprica JL-4 TaxID=694437 RepID=A0A7X9RT02_9BACT|nr:J domain-containing protein [Flammeovirga aprica]NME67741.1 J domain-containing protein [Flammeovirga aprica JL-4]
MDNYYDILGIDKSADKKEIKKAYLTLAKKYHPDVNQSDETLEEKFKLINEAYDTLYDDTKKFQYDNGLNYFSFHNSTTAETSSTTRTYTREENQRREEYKAHVAEETKKEKRQFKKYVPFMVGGYVVAMIGFISFFVHRQSKLADEAYHSALTNLKENRTRQAQQDAKQLFEYEDYQRAELIQGCIEVILKKPSSALFHLQKVESEMDEETAFAGDLYYYKGRALYLDGDGVGAVEAFEKAYKYNNGDDAVDFWLGKTYNDLLLEYGKASKAFQKVTKESKFYEESILMTGVALQNDRQFSLSQQYLLEALNFKKHKALANYYLGWHYKLGVKNAGKACIYWETSAKQGYAEALYQFRRHCQ